MFPPTTTGANGPCTAQLENIAVYEGTLNTRIYLPENPARSKWTNTATTNELDEAVIVNNDDTVAPNYAADYAYDRCSGLTIKNATTTAEPGHQLSTVGLYKVECGGDQFAFKFLAVRQGLIFSIRKLDENTVEVTCSTIYADSNYDPIAAIFTLYVDDDPIATDTPQRTTEDSYTWISTSTFKTAYSSSSTYQCGQTFGQPTEIEDPNVAMNAPTFNQFSLGGNISRNFYGKFVVKAELYQRCDGCCQSRSTCAVVVTTRNGGRFLIHESFCDDNKCKMTVISASGMSSKWKLLNEKQVLRSKIGDFVDAGNGVPFLQRKSDCRETCKRMMNLP